MTAEAAIRQAPRAPAPFAPYHPWDRNFFLTITLLIWLGIVMGFGPEIQQHIQSNEPAYPWIVHVHAVAFVGWLVVLTTQVLLIRRRRLDLHRMLGLAAMGLAALMVVLGPAVAIVMGRVHFGTKDADPAFLAIQLIDIFAFATMVSAAFAWRHVPSAHKRLILIATLYISDAGFARWMGGTFSGLLGGGYWGTFAGYYACNDALLLGVGLYDLATRRRLHPAWMAGAGWTVLLQVTAVYLYGVAWWKPVSVHLLGF